jgi:very-short-patch-repair endonuclease
VSEKPEKIYRSKRSSNESRRFSNIADNFAINNQIIQATGNWREILSIYAKEHPNFNSVNWATTLSKLGRLMHRDVKAMKQSDGFRALLRDLGTSMTAARELRKFGTSRDVANIVHSLAKMAVPSNDVVDILSAVVAGAEWLVEAADPHTISNTAWAFAKLNTPAPALFEKIDERAYCLVESGTPQAIANTAWACATLNAPAPLLFEKIEERSAWLVKLGKPQEIANTVWAFAALKTPAPALCKEIEEHPMSVVGHGSAHAMSATAWAFATLNVAAPALFKKIDERASSLVDSAAPQAISNTLWAFATLRTPAPALLEKIPERASFLLDNGKPQEIANVAWAFSILLPSEIALTTPARDLFEKIEEHASFIVEHENGTPQTISNIAGAFATVLYDAPAFFSAVDSRSEFLIDAGTSQCVSNTAMAFAELGIAPASLFASLEKRADRFLESASLQSVCSVCWSLAILDLSRQHESLLQSLWAHAMRSDSLAQSPTSQQLSAPQLQQLVQVELHSEANGVKLEFPVPLSLRRRMEESSWKFTNSVSKLEEEYSALLSSLGFEHKREVPPVQGAGGMLSIDMACARRRVAVEFDGPWHYLNNGRENGKTVAKRRLLERLGWKVVSLSYLHSNLLDDEKFLEKLKEDGEFDGDRSDMKKVYLRKQLREAGVILE